jgi:hypothetical protein
MQLRETHRPLISEKITSYGNALKLHDRMFEAPTFLINSAKDIMGCAFVTAAAVVDASSHGLTTVSSCERTEERCFDFENRGRQHPGVS